MLQGIHPILTGPILAALDAMGHSDSVAIVDAHFPAARVGAGAVVIELPLLDSAAVIAAVRTVLPLDDAPGIDLMQNLDGSRLPIHDELVAAASAQPEDAQEIERYAFYERAAGASLILRTGETRSYGNALVRKGLVTPS